MLLDRHGEIIDSPIDQTPLKEKWKDYIKYKKHYRLYSFTKEELREKIQVLKNQGKSFINSAILIGGFIRELSVNENFNQQFKAAFPKLDSFRVLALQLFILMHEDDEEWTFSESEKDGFVFRDKHYTVLMQG